MEQEQEPRVIFDPIFGMGLEWPDGERRFAPPRIVCMNTLATAVRQEQGNREQRRRARRER